MPLNDDGSVKFGMWSRRISGPEALQPGQRLVIAKGTTVRLLKPDSGLGEFRGPAEVQAGNISQDTAPLWSSRAGLLTWKPEGAATTGGTVGILSPVGVTRFTNPMVMWNAEREKQYDVAVVDTDDPNARPRVLQNVRPPVRLGGLKTSESRLLIPGRSYEVYVRESGQQANVGAARVLVASDAVDRAPSLQPADLIIEAFEAMRARPFRTGDAFFALQQLPPEWRRTELGLRLWASVGAELGFYGETRDAIALLAGRPLPKATKD